MIKKILEDNLLVGQVVYECKRTFYA